jgi:predicted secreted protein
MQAMDWVARSLLTTLLAVIVLAGLSIYAGVLLKLSVAGAFGLYFVLWWTLLFAVLPVRIRTQAEVGEIAEGTDPGAPAAPALRERAIWTTIAAGIVFVGVAVFFPLAGL